MTFYSGFALKGDQKLFDSWLIEDDYTVAGFSYGAILALKALLSRQRRIDRLQLFSPAFFQTKSERFKRLQLNAFDEDKSRYLAQFLNNCYAPAANNETVELDHDASREVLDELLHFEWSRNDLEKLQDEGIEIEIYLGEKDKIIDAEKAKEFFQPFATIYWIKASGHFLLKE